MELEAGGNYFSRLALLEESKSLPYGAVWDFYCLTADVPPAEAWIREIEAYEKTVLGKREAAKK
jgi:L-rhamnose isomerase